MRYTLRIIMILALCVPAFVGARAEQAPVSLTVLADPILVVPLTQVARDYTRKTGTSITIVATDGEEAAQQIGQGLDAHLLITANQVLLKKLNEQGLVDVFGKRVVTRAALALAAPAGLARRSDLAKHISFSAILYAQPSLPLYLLADSTFAGARAQALVHSDAYPPDMQERLVTLGTQEALMQRLKLSPGFALLLVPDVVSLPELQTLIALPTETVAPVRYQAVLIASNAIEPSRALIRYLLEDPAQRILQNFGFLPASDAP